MFRAIWSNMFHLADCLWGFPCIQEDRANLERTICAKLSAMLVDKAGRKNERSGNHLSLRVTPYNELMPKKTGDEMGFYQSSSLFGNSWNHLFQAFIVLDYGQKLLWFFPIIFWGVLVLRLNGAGDFKNRF